MTDYTRTVDELENVASMFWPAEISQRAADLSVIPLLLESQDEFLSILNVSVRDIGGVFEVLSASTLSSNLFLKHLVLLADFGGEMLQRINRQFASLFPNGILSYIFAGSAHQYHFIELPLSGSLSNDKLGISNRKLVEEQTLDNLQRDVIALLTFGSAATDEHTAYVLSKCSVGDYIGKPDDLEKFVKQRYIWVSRITGGSRSNHMGQLAQKFVQVFIEEQFAQDDISIRPNGHIPGVTHTATDDTRETTFDLVVMKDNKYVAIEVSFQVTTNSVIERKSGQAQARFQQIEQAGHKIAYVLDGAGNFQRRTALQTLLNHSHCSVAFSQDELYLLCDFLRDALVTS